MSTKTHMLENGKLSFELPADERKHIISAIARRLQEQETFLEHHTYFALHEARQRFVDHLHKKRMSLLCSHFYVVFDPDTMRYIDEPTQILIRGYLDAPAQRPPLPSSPDRTLIGHYALTEEELDDIPI